jgi:hypothetical protein
MADLITTVASQTGIEPEKVKMALGAVLTFLKSHLDPGIYEKLHSALPGAGEMVSSHQAVEATAKPGLVGAITSAVSKVLGGEAGQEVNLVSTLSKLGLSVPQIEALLSKAFDISRPSFRPS